MKHSEQLNELATALSKAQGEMEHASKDKTNPHFRSKYADLAAIWDAIRAPLAKYGLSALQLPFTDETGNVHVSTMLLHSSGQWIEASYSLPATKPDLQGFGSALTYMKRYALTGMGVAPADDDGESAVRGHYENVPAASPPPLDRPKGNGDPRLAAIQWVKTAEEAVAGMTNAISLRTWERNNADGMKKLMAVDTKMHDRMQDIINERFMALKAATLNAG